MVAAQGVYSRQNSIMAYAFLAPNPMAARLAASVCIPWAEFTLLMPNSTQKLDTTTSLAEIPEISATPSCQCPSPAGAIIGSIQRPMTAPKLWDTSVTMPVLPKFSKNQITMDARKIVVPALVR